MTYLNMLSVHDLVVLTMTANTAMDDANVRSALRAPHGARHRER
jgi:hypothetical protein